MKSEQLFNVVESFSAALKRASPDLVDSKHARKFAREAAKWLIGRHLGRRAVGAALILTGLRAAVKLSSQIQRDRSKAA